MTEEEKEKIMQLITSGIEELKKSIAEMEDRRGEGNLPYVQYRTKTRQFVSWTTHNEKKSNLRV
jgi:hypothetical protein